MKSHLTFDFGSLDSKEEGKELLEEALKIESLPSISFDSIQEFQSKYNEFTEKTPEVAKKLFNVHINGIGPGEILCYYLFTSITVGGKKSTIDLYNNGQPFAECKSGIYNLSRGVITNFKMAKDTCPSVAKLRNDLTTFNNNYKACVGDDLPGWKNDGDLAVTSIDKWKQINLNQMSQPPVYTDMRYNHATGDLEFLNHGTIIRATPDSLLSDIMSKRTCTYAQPTFQDIEVSWKQTVDENYINNKQFCIFDPKMKMVHAGFINKNDIVLMNTARSQPIVGIKCEIPSRKKVPNAK